MSRWWNKPADPPDVKYHGLVNYGATCYLNSVLQVLFMTEEFREAINRLTIPSEVYIDHHLKGLFEELLRRRADPYYILRALEVNNVYEQQDAAEYFERILRKTSEDAAKIFHGRLSHRTTCSECKTPTDSEGPFWHLPLELDSPDGKYSVENGIEMFFKPTTFNGDNQVYCEICDAKVDANRKYVITRHPDVLLLMLKRFDFSYQYMSHIKIHCNAEVPHIIEIPENQTYELYAVVEHSGDLRGGHYRAIIKSRDEGDEWFVFNDSSVTQFGINPFPDNVNVAEFRDAYLLFYRKKVADCPISDPCSVRDYNPNIIQDQSPKEENLQPGDDTETLNENISLTDDLKRQIDHISTEAKPEKREINESEEIDPDQQRLPEEQTARNRQIEGLSQDETKYPQDVTMEDEEEQEENRHQIIGEDQIQGLVVGKTEPTKLGNMQTDMNYDHHVDSPEPAAFHKNLWEQQGPAEERADEVRRKHETENSNKLITTSQDPGADEAENNKPTENMRYNHNEAESGELNKLEENEQIGEEASHLKENLSGNINENFSDKEKKFAHISTEAKPEVRNPEKREINESEEIDPDQQRLPEEQTGRERQTERLSHDETKYPQDITMEDEEEQEENRNQIIGEDQIQGLVAGEREPTKLGNMQTDMNYDVDTTEPAASERQANLWEQQGSAEERTEEVRRKQETENSNTLIRTSEETGADENNKLLPSGNKSYNHNQGERAELNKPEKNEQIGEKVSQLKENFSPQNPESKTFSKIPQSLLTPDEPNIDDKHQRRNEMTDNASKTQTQETEDVDETHVHKDKPKVEKGGKNKQKSQITRKRNRSDRGKKENQDNTDRTGEDEVAAYSDSRQLYYDGSEEVIKKKHTKQKEHTSHDTHNELDLKKTRKNKNYKIAASLTGNHEADRDQETIQENFQSYRNKGSKGAEVKRQGPNQAEFELKTIEEDIWEYSPSGKGKTKLMVKTITEEITTVNNSNNRKTISDEGNVDCDLEDGDFSSAKEKTTILSEPLLPEQQNPTSKENTRGAKEDEYRMNISDETELEAQQRRQDMKKKCSCCTCAIL